ncbi:hypothetical protein NHG34_08190 [Aerococcaceae bacterium NML190938]|nr:hypothetical protein [Aerococcaceae bacterium NML190938]
MIDRTILDYQRPPSENERTAIFRLFEDEESVAFALLTIYHAGRIEGIRQERRKKALKKAKEQARAFNRNAYRQCVGREPKNDEEVTTWVNDLVGCPPKRVPILKEYRINGEVVGTEWV